MRHTCEFRLHGGAVRSQPTNMDRSAELTDAVEGGGAAVAHGQHRSRGGDGSDRDGQGNRPAGWCRRTLQPRPAGARAPCPRPWQPPRRPAQRLSHPARSSESARSQRERRYEPGGRELRLRCHAGPWLRASRIWSGTVHLSAALMHSNSQCSPAVHVLPQMRVLDFEYSIRLDDHRGGE